MKKLVILLALALMVLGVATVSGQDAVELRITWYNDGTEGDALRTALDQFEAANAGIKVVIDDIGYKDPNVYHSTIQAQVESGSPPDLARVNDVARLAGTYLDLTPLVKDSKYWTDSFSQAVLDSLRVDANDKGIYGFPLNFTITAPFINRTLFEQAGLKSPVTAKPMSHGTNGQKPPRKSLMQLVHRLRLHSNPVVNGSGVSRSLKVANGLTRTETSP